MTTQNDVEMEREFVGATLAERYHIQRVIAGGHFSVVFLARLQLFDLYIRKAAVKITRAKDIAREKAADIFRDAIILARIEDENPNPESARFLVKIYDAGLLPEQGGRGFLAMQCVEGGTLQDHIRAAGRLPIAAGWRYAEQICTGLSLAHGGREKAVHCDLKPNNILIDNACDEVRIADFGLAQRISATLGYVPDNPAPLEYKAPEAMLNQTVCASDVYSLGVTFYEMFTGVHPFSRILEPRKMGEAERVEFHRSRRKSLFLEPPSRHNFDMTPRMDEIVMGCLKFEAGERFQDALELLEAVQSVRNGESDPRIAHYDEGAEALRQEPPDFRAALIALRKALDASGARDRFHLNILLALARALQGEERWSEAFERLREVEVLENGALRPEEMASLFGESATVLRRMGGVALAKRYEERRRKLVGER